MINNNKYLKFIFKSVAILLITLNVAITFSYTFFIHKHTLENGKVVFHSHPYKKSNDQPVKHSHNDFTYHISQKTETIFTPNITFDFSITYSCFNYKFQQLIFASTKLETPNLRAPPITLS